MEQCCALCAKRAMMLCDSDQAKLCWDCDEKVHSANFLVAKHSRVLLCRLCHSPTPWKASGTKLTPTVSFCQRCVADRHAGFHRLVNNVDEDGEYGSSHVYDDDNDGDDYDDDEDEDDDDVDEDEDEDEENEEGGNQVVPMSSASATSPPNGTGLPLKRWRNNSVDSHDETACSSSSSEMLVSAALPSNDESTSLSVFGSLKRHRFDERNY